MNLLSSWFGEASGEEGAEARKVIADILDTMREAVIITDSETRIISSNQRAYEAFSRGKGELEKKLLADVIDDSAVHDAFIRTLKSKNTSQARFEFLNPDKRIFSVRIAPIALNGSTSVIGFFYEETRMERLEQVRQEFLSNVSHELRTPLTSIIAFAETLQDGAADNKEDSQRFLGVIRKNAERMHHLIDDILELSAIEAGKVRIEKREINIARLADEVFTNLAGKAKTRSVTLKNDIPAGRKIYADPVRLEQMLTNLADNAVKFSRKGATIVISVGEKSETDLISVADQGEGISDEHLPRLFERFYRTDKARSRDAGGTGLGLAIVKHLARLHRGEVSVSSTVGQGSVFTIELPKPPAN